MMQTQAIFSSAFVKPGIVLVRDGIHFPRPFELKSIASQQGWNIVESNAVEIDRKVNEAGWHFFWMVPVIESSAFAFNPDKAVAKALGQLLTELGRFNAVEIANLRVRSFLGLHYATVRGHARHIQQSPILLRYPHL